MARIAGIVAGLVAVVLLLPVQVASVIDGREELWVKTTAGWAYHVPLDSQWIVLGLSILGGLLAGLVTWAGATLFRHPNAKHRRRAVAALALSLAAVALIAVIFANQPPSIYKHVL